MDDIVETTNHFRCIDLIIDRAEEKLSESFVKEIHRILKTGTSDSRKSWFNVGDYKKLPNEVGGNATCPPEEVHTRMKALLITEELKLFYYRGLKEWGHVNGYLTDTCLTAQDYYKELLDYFKIKY